MPKAASFKGRSINSLPALISLHRDEDKDNGDDVFDIGKPGATAAQLQVSDDVKVPRLRTVQSHRIEDVESDSPKRRRSLNWAGPIGRLWHRQSTV